MQSFDSQQEKEKRDILLFVKNMAFLVNTPFFAWDSSNSIVEINQNLAHLLGEERTQLIGRTIFSLFSPEYSAKVHELIRNPKPESANQGIIIPLQQKTGQVREILWSPTRIPDSSGQTILSIGQGLDITEQRWAIDYLKRYIAELTRKNDELEEMRTQLQEHNKNLDEKIRKRTCEIEELLKQKDEFINQIGHDLKTPLTPILALIPILLKKETDPKKKVHLETIDRNATHLHTLLTSLIRYAYLNKAYMPRKGIEISVSQMIEELIITFEFKILKKHLLVENQIPDQITLRISPLDFDTIFGNLLDNAIKFTDQGGRIRICGEETDEWIKIVIRDTGIGLDPVERRRIFNPMYKADLSRHNIQSHGLGLSVTKELIEQNGGTITVESEGKGKGSSFSVCFRLRHKVGERKPISRP